MGKGKSADATEYWRRYSERADKDFPVLLRTGIKPSTFSAYKMQKRFPRADEAVRIAAAVGTTVEFLVTGKDPQGLPPRIIDLAKGIARLAEDDIAAIEAIVAVKTAARRAAQANA